MLQWNRYIIKSRNLKDIHGIYSELYNPFDQLKYKISKEIISIVNYYKYYLNYSIRTHT